LAAELRERFPNAMVNLIESRGGRFEVMLNSEPIFEKSKLDRHARPGEVVALLEAKGMR
jgi:selT/selW/selH-like putative selenoprotein